MAGRAYGRMPTRGIQNMVPYKVEIQEKEMTKPLNPEVALTYDDNNNLSTVTKIVSGKVYRQTLSYDGDNNLTGVSPWIEI